MFKTSFTKAQGAGNDFLIVEGAPELFPQREEWTRRICDRHYGVGADGVLFVTVPGPSGTEADLRIFNCDGSEAEISGNGTRCAAAWLVGEGHARGELSIQTRAGRKRLRAISRDANRFVFEMEMGAPILDTASIPFAPPAATPVSGPIVGFELPLASGSRRVTVTSMGNPHCSTLVAGFDWDWQALGAEIERHPYFPRRTNVEFVHPLGPHQIEVRYWERGVGQTLSSGTGSCAAAVAAILNGRAENPVTVKTLAGDLQVRWENEEVFLTGPAEIICRGEFFCREAGEAKDA